MDEKQAREFGQYLQKHRETAGISIRGLAERVGVNQATITRFERGEVAFPRVDILEAIAEHLDLAVTDLLAMSGYPQSSELPHLQPYLRAKYSGLSPAALAEIEAVIAREIPQTRGPINGEDEQ